MKSNSKTVNLHQRGRKAVCSGWRRRSGLEGMFGVVKCMCLVIGQHDWPCLHVISLACWMAKSAPQTARQLNRKLT